jgi:hypothetical protein
MRRWLDRPLRWLVARICRTGRVLPVPALRAMMHLAWRFHESACARDLAEAVVVADPADLTARRIILRALRGEGRIEEACIRLDELVGGLRADRDHSVALMIEAAEVANDAGDMAGMRRWCALALGHDRSDRRALTLMHRAAVKSLPLDTLRSEVADWLARGGLHAETVADTALRIAFYEDGDWSAVVSLWDRFGPRGTEWGVHRTLALARQGDLGAAETALDELRRSLGAEDCRGRDEADLVAAELARERGDQAGQYDAINRVLARHGLAPLAYSAGGGVLDPATLRCAALPPIGAGPLVTVIMTVYGENPRLAAAVRSVLAQTYRHIELILVDDCSPDDTLSILNDFAREDARVRVLKTAVNGGTYLAKNLALTHARGELIAFMDSDDWAHPERTENQVRALQEHTQAVAVWHNSLRITQGGQIEWRRSALRRAPISIMFRREVHERIGFFDGVRVGADSELIARIVSAYGRARVIHRPLPTTFMSRHSLSLTGGGYHAIGWRALTGERLAYDRAFRAWHRRMAACGEVAYLPYPSVDRPFPSALGLGNDDSLSDEVTLDTPLSTEPGGEG